MLLLVTLGHLYNLMSLTGGVVGDIFSDPSKEVAQSLLRSSLWFSLTLYRITVGCDVVQPLSLAPPPTVAALLYAWICPYIEVKLEKLSDPSP